MMPQPFAISPTAIAAIEQDPQSYSTVRLDGTVERHAPFLDGGAYELQDESDSIWVVTDRPLPPVGSQISIKAAIESESISMGGQLVAQVYARERKRLETDASEESK
jgi:hypothetical protein